MGTAHPHIAWETEGLGKFQCVLTAVEEKSKRVDGIWLGGGVCPCCYSADLEEFDKMMIG